MDENIDEKKALSPISLYELGCILQDLSSRLRVTSIINDILQPLEQLTQYKYTIKLEDVGEEAWYLHNEFTTTMHSSKHLSATKLNEEEIRLLEDTIIRWHALIEERLGELYLIAPDTIIIHKRLSKGIKGFIEDDLLQLLTLSEIRSLDEACVCILMSSNTASEIMSLRTAESLLRRWYKKKTGNILQKKPWGYVLKKLICEYPNEIDRPKEIKLLGYLNERRNEIAHPERMSTPHDAECTFMNIITLIDALKDYLKDNENKQENNV